MPRNEFIVGKNKISEKKETFFLDFWPASSDFRRVSQKTVLKEAKEMKDIPKGSGEFGQLDNALEDLAGVY